MGNERGGYCDPDANRLTLLATRVTVKYQDALSSYRENVYDDGSTNPVWAKNMGRRMANAGIALFLGTVPADYLIGRNSAYMAGWTSAVVLVCAYGMFLSARDPEEPTLGPKEDVLLDQHGEQVPSHVFSSPTQISPDICYEGFSVQE